MRLLHRTILSYLIFSVILVLVAIPVFYGIIHKMFLNDVDEALYQRKKELVYRLNKNPDHVFLSTWQDMDGNTEIRPFEGGAHRDSLYNIERYDSVNAETTAYRELSTVITVNQHPYFLLLRLSLVDSEDLAQGIVTTQIILLAALLMGLLLLSRWQSKKRWQPFYHTLEQLKKFELDANQPLQPDPTRIREFRDLNNAIRHLTEKNREVYLQQKEFTENAAHEMQTPLAVFQSKLDLLLQHSHLNREQAELIQSLAEATQRLSRLNKALLLLARIGNRQFMDTAVIHVLDVTEKTLAQFAEQIQAKQLTIQKKLDPSLTVKANPALVEMLLSNLLSNAIRHNYPGGTVDIELAGRRLTIQNTGHPLSFDPARIFDRFRKGDSSSNSIGLGLAIVRQIGEVSGFSVAYSYTNNLHIFSVML